MATLLRDKLHENVARITGPLVIDILYIGHTNEAFKQGKQCLISMVYEIEHTNDSIELLMNAKILCEY